LTTILYTSLVVLSLERVGSVGEGAEQLIIVEVPLHWWHTSDGVLRFKRDLPFVFLPFPSVFPSMTPRSTALSRVDQPFIRRGINRLHSFPWSTFASRDDDKCSPLQLPASSSSSWARIITLSRESQRPAL